MELPPMPKIPFLKSALKPLWDYLARVKLSVDNTMVYSEHGKAGVIIGTRPEDKSSSHPWKVTSNGNDSLTVAPGSILTWMNDPAAGISTIPSYINLEEVIRYSGGTLESISNGDTVIWARCNHEAAPDHDIFETDHTDGLIISRVIPDSTSSFSLHSGTAMPTSGSDEINLELARIDVTDGIATVTRQILTHNPPMWLIDIPPESEGL